MWNMNDIKHSNLLIISNLHGGGVNYPFLLADIVFTRLSAIGAGSRFLFLECLTKKG